MQRNDAPLTRRGFLGGVSAAAAVAAFPTIVPGSALGCGDDSPSERVRLGFVGVRNQGTNNLKALGKHAVAVCDVDEDVLGKARDLAEKGSGHGVKTYGDYRRLLEDKDVDAIVVTTPDHWHARITCDACAAGKDVYCEKPLSLTIAEGRAMVQAAREHGRIVQTGSQQRSDEKFRLACELVRSGRIGKVKRVLVGLPEVNFDGPAVPDGDPPAGLDYDFWLGPAPRRPYNAKHVHYLFRFFWDYSGGQMTNFGAHHLDIAQWALGRDDSGPVAIEGLATFHPEGWYEVPMTSRVDFTYDDGVVVRCEQGTKGIRGGVTFEGERGTIFVTRGKLESDPDEIAREPLSAGDTRLYVSRDHHANWLECIRSREKPICDVEIGHRSATVCHLGNIACRLGRKIAWDPAREEITGDSEAAAMVRRPYREPWVHPVRA
jgi:predicted dehydrogenase